MDLESDVTPAGLGTLVWNTVQLELNARSCDEGTQEHTVFITGLNLIYSELDRRERELYTSQLHDQGLGQLLREANTDLFNNPDHGDSTWVLFSDILHPKNSILALDKREQDY